MDLKALRVQEQIESHKVHRLEIWVGFAGGFGKWSLISGLIGVLYLLGKEHAGRETAVSYVADMPIISSVSIGLAVTGWVLYLNESRLRKDYVERSNKRICKLEQMIDPNRTSSELTERGNTRKEDRV